jgi:hypothetical protein
MKKITKVFSLGILALVTCFASTGCFASLYTRKGENKIEQACTDCKPVTDIFSLVENIEIMMKKVGVIKGNYKLTNTKGTYDISFEAVLANKRENWDVHAKTTYNDKNIEFYTKNKKFYLIYPNNGANLIMKDSLDNLVVETKSTLDNLNVTYDKENLKDLIMGDKLEGFDFEIIKTNASFVQNEDSTYSIRYLKDSLVCEYVVTNNF